MGSGNPPVIHDSLFQCQNGGPTYYYYYNTSISGSGNTAVGPGAQANNIHQPPPREGLRAHGHSPRHGSPRDREQQEPTYKPGRKSFSSENNSGTYCLPNISQAYYQEKSSTKWNPTPSLWILTQQASSFSDSSSDVSSQFSGSPGRRRRVFKKTYSTYNLVNNSGQVVVGGRTATIKGATLNHPTGEESLEQPGASVIPPPENSSSKETNSENYRGISEETIIKVGENCPGSYYGFNREQQDVKKAQKWNAKPSKVILYSKGDAKFKWSIEEFLENPVKFICDMDNNACSLQEEKEDFILHEILPSLEEVWGRCFSSNERIYEILARISCSRKNAKVVRQALQLLLYLICKDNFDSCQENVLVVEAVIRSSILSPEGLFKTDLHSERELKLYAYSRILSSLVIQQVRKGELRIETLKQDLKKLRKELKQFGDQLENKKKDRFRYSIEFILEAIPCLLKPQDKLKVLLDECQEFCSNRKINSGELKVLQGLKKDSNWIDLHCIFIYLHGKVYCERPVPQMETEGRAMTLFRLLVETYLRRGGGDDWRFCLSAASILSDIAMNNVTKEVRTEAGECLEDLLKDTKVQKTPESRASVQRRASEVLLCHDKEIRTFLVDFLYKNQSLEHDLPEDLHIKHLSSMYRAPTLEISQTVISRSSDYFVTHGMFQRQKVAVKVLFVKKQHLLEDNPSTHARERLTREADYLRRLNKSRHPNITVLLGYNTKSLPYHIITTFEKFGDLLQFVRRSRENSPRPQPFQLLRMLVDIADALLYLEKLDLVHRAVMAANVLVGDYYVCKLSGMQSLQQLTNQGDDPDSAYSNCSVNDGLPEFVSTKDDEELPVRWQAPESLSEHRYSTASDVWAFGMLMYEVLTYGCLPYRHIGKDDEVSFHITNGKDVQPDSEQCFEENEYELMMQCCELQRRRRPKLFEVKARLIEMHENADEEQPRPDPPSLDNHVSYESSSIGDEEDLYEDVEVLISSVEVQDVKTSGLVTSEGGSVSVNGVQLTCPAGAVDDPVNIKLKLQEPQNYYGLILNHGLENDLIFVAPIISCQPNGQTFKKHVTLTILLDRYEKQTSTEALLVLHGTPATDGRILWEDVTQDSKFDLEKKELKVEIAQFSLIAALLRLTWVPTKEIATRLNLVSFKYTLLVLFKSNHQHSPFEDLALVFMSQDVYQEQFYRERDDSALVQLKRDGFEELASNVGQEIGYVYNKERLTVSFQLGEDYKPANDKQQSVTFAVDSSVWWSIGHVLKLPLQASGTDAKILCGRIVVQGQHGHVREDHFCQQDFCGYARRILGVENVIFNLTPVTLKLGLPEETLNQVVAYWQSEAKQLEVILLHWRENQENTDDYAVLRKALEGLEPEDYRVKERGQMHIEHLRKLAVTILGLQHKDPNMTKYLGQKIKKLCYSVLRDCCIEMATSKEDLDLATSAENCAGLLEVHRQIPEDVAKKYKHMCLSPEESIAANFLMIVPHIVQSIKKIFQDKKIPQVQSGLRGVRDETTLDKIVSDIQEAAKNKSIFRLLREVCNILENLCLNNSDNRSTEDKIHEWGGSAMVIVMLEFLEKFFQSSEARRLHKRLHVFSVDIRDILSNPADFEGSSLRDFHNVALSLLKFAKFDPSQLVRFELNDPQSSCNTRGNDGLKFDKSRELFSQLFWFSKESNDALQLEAIACVHIEGSIRTIGAFESLITLPSSRREDVNRVPIGSLSVVVRREHDDSGNLRITLYATQKEKITKALKYLENEIGADVVDLSQTEITPTHLKLRSFAKAGTLVKLRLVHKWGSEALVLDSNDFVTLADSTTGGASVPDPEIAAEINQLALRSELPALPEASDSAVANYSSNFVMDPSNAELIQRHLHEQRGRIEIHYHQNFLRGHVCVVGENTSLNMQLPSTEQRSLEAGPSAASHNCLTPGTGEHQE